MKPTYGSPIKVNKEQEVFVPGASNYLKRPESIGTDLGSRN
jgi:hypothetical protein